MLKFPPVKPYKMPDYIVIKTILNNSKHFSYRMFDKTGNEVGKMIAYPQYVNTSFREFSPNADKYRSFYIAKLISYIRNKGIGTSFINIAKKESLRNFCSGNVHVISSDLYDKKNPPHIFYRKQGFNFNKYSGHTQKYIDECIKYKEPYYPGICKNEIPMYIEKCTVNQEKDLEKYFQFKVKFKDIFG